jgi:hypothetical protein
MKKWIIVVVLVVPLFGCASWATVTDADKAVNHQSMEAGKFIVEETTALAEEIASLPPEEIGGRLGAILQAGRDVAENAAILQEKVIGAPEVPAPYSPEKSAELRVESAEDHVAPGWWQKVIAALGVATVAGGIGLKVGSRFLPGPWGLALDAVVEGIAGFRHRVENDPKLKAGDAGAIAAALLAELERTQALKGDATRELVRSKAKDAERKINGGSPA